MPTLRRFFSSLFALVLITAAACGGSTEPVVTEPPPDPSGHGGGLVSPGTEGEQVDITEERVLLEVGAPAPDFLALDQHGRRHTLAEHRGRPVVVYFYPRDGTPGCTQEACAFRDKWSRITDAGAALYGISTDSVESHRAFAEQHALPFPLLADPEQHILDRFGVTSTNGRSLRVTFVVGPDGRISHVFPDVDPAVHSTEVLQALASVPPTPARTHLHSVVTAQDRSGDDRALDAGRRPEALLAFFGIEEGMRVAELFAGGGYTAELLARAVGPQGRVYAQNSRVVLERFARQPWAARLRQRVMRNVTRLDRELDRPFPPNVRNLDTVLFLLAYHDAVWLETDRAAMNRAIFEALKPGGVYGIVDHAAAPGRGTEDAQTLHRIERSTLVAEVEAAGFVLAAEAYFLSNPDDPHDWNASPSQAGERRGASDRFVLRFVKPADPPAEGGEPAAP
jgi:predicted methyltransferase